MSNANNKIKVISLKNIANRFPDFTTELTKYTQLPEDKKSEFFNELEARTANILKQLEKSIYLTKNYPDVYKVKEESIAWYNPEFLLQISIKHNLKLSALHFLENTSLVEINVRKQLDGKLNKVEEMFEIYADKMDNDLITSYNKEKNSVLKKVREQEKKEGKLEENQIEVDITEINLGPTR